MYTDDDRLILFTTRDARQGAELALVLEARAFDVDLERIGRSTVVRVAATQFEAARAELETYARENAAAWRPRAEPQLSGRAWPGVIAYVAAIVLIVLPVRNFTFGRDWVEAGRVDSAAIFAGEWWRAVTALTLHADAAHLLGNAGFGAFFGYSLGRSVGGGVCWALIVGCGMAGNLANAWLAGPDHRAIGASTAVFAALGLLTGHSWRTGFRVWSHWRQRIAPLIAGIGLLAFTGTGGENTDIGAHLLGFVAGLIAGAAWLKPAAPAGQRVQIGAGAAAIGLIVLSWALALTR